MKLGSIAALLLLSGTITAQEPVGGLGKLREWIARSPVSFLPPVSGPRSFSPSSETTARDTPIMEHGSAPSFEIVSRISDSDLVGSAAPVARYDRVRAAVATDPPTPADSAATPIVQLTPKIRARARALGNDPSRIYEWVYNNVELELYSGAMQTSESVLMSRRAGDYDMATVLVALLRAAGVPARFVRGTVRMDMNALMNLVGAKAVDAAVYMAQQAFPLDVAGATWI